MAAVSSLPNTTPGFGSSKAFGSHDSGNADTQQHSTTTDGQEHDGNVPRGPVTATVNFYNPPTDGSSPYYYVEKPPEGIPQRNFSDSDHEVSVGDIRGQENSFELDRHAFAALQNHPHNPAIDWEDDESVKTHYYPEVEKILLTQIPGSPQKIVLFDHTIRRAQPNAHRAPVTRAHIDQTPRSAKMRVEEHLSSEEAEQVLKDGTRYRIINVWRPLNGAVESHPLAFANSESVPDDDMVPVAHKYPHKTGETAAIQHNPQHKWHYWSGMTNDERLLLQCFDSDKPMNRVPHTAFVDPRSTESSKPRESIEVRALIIG